MDFVNLSQDLFQSSIMKEFYSSGLSSLKLKVKIVHYLRFCRFFTREGNNNINNEKNWRNIISLIKFKLSLENRLHSYTDVSSRNLISRVHRVYILQLFLFKSEKFIRIIYTWFFLTSANWWRMWYKENIFYDLMNRLFTQ